MVSGPDDLLQLVSTGEGSAKTVYDLLTSFQRGYPLGNLRPLLRSNNDVVVTDAAWIASELGAKSRAFLAELGGLLAHASAKVRFHALDALLASAGAEDGHIVAQMLMLLDDDVAAVRWKAIMCVVQASEDQLRAAQAHLAGAAPGSKEGRNLELVLAATGGQRGTIDLMIESPDPVRRRFGVATAGRVLSMDGRPLQDALGHWDPEIAEAARSIRFMTE